MKKVKILTFCLLLALVSFAFAGCGDQNDSKKEENEFIEVMSIECVMNGKVFTHKSKIVFEYSQPEDMSETEYNRLDSTHQLSFSPSLFIDIDRNRSNIETFKTGDTIGWSYNAPYENKWRKSTITSKSINYVCIKIITDHLLEIRFFDGSIDSILVDNFQIAYFN